MKVTVRYGEKKAFGNMSDASDYGLLIERFYQELVILDIRFFDDEAGRGVGENQGTVTGASIELSKEHARKLAVGILSALDQSSSSVVPLAFGKANLDPREQMIAGLKRVIEPANLFVLASRDGRTLQTMRSQQRALYFTGTPRHWNEGSGDYATKAWNKTVAKRDHVIAVPWRDHYQRQVDELELPA